MFLVNMFPVKMFAIPLFILVVNFKTLFKPGSIIYAVLHSRHKLT